MAPRLAVFPLLLAFGLPVAHGGTALLQVAAVIAPHVDAQVQSAPPTILVEPRDIDRGYVDIAVPLVVRVRSNLDGPFTLEFRSVHDIVARVVPRTASPPLPASFNGGLLLPPTVRDQSLFVNLRLILAPQAVAGTYPWPVRVGGAG
jgi:hypothetical protein